MYILGNADKSLLTTKNEENKYYDKNIKIDINDTNNTHAIIAKTVKNGSTCLDIGCGAGYIGEILKENRKCTVYGIDIDKEAIKVATSKKIYKDIYNFSIMDYSNRKFQDFLKNAPMFDYIFLADVLEHVVNPGEVLYNFSQKLSKKGKFLVSVPNISHFDIVKGLINRTFNYNKIGILDNTHLRFFTKNSFIDMINGINEVYGTNFSVKLIGKTINEPGYLELYPSLLRILNDDQEACVLQYVYEIENNLKKGDNQKFENKDYFSLIEEYLGNREILLLQLKEEENKILELNNKIDELSKNLEQQQIEYRKIISSKSWKITEPLRKLSAHIHSNRTK